MTRTRASLLLISFLSLYCELMFIRWLPSAIHLLGYFTNLVLIATFLGLGTGVARKSQSESVPWMAFGALAVLTGLTLFLHVYRLDILLGIGEGSAAGGQYFINDTAAYSAFGFYTTIVVFFVGTALTFVPSGQLVGRYLAELPALEGYGINILGSLLGIAFFTVLSVCGAPPAVWVGLGLLGMAWFLPRKSMGVAIAIVLAASTWGMERWEAKTLQSEIIWSPYYNIHLRALDVPDGGYLVHVNNNFLLTAVNLNPDIKDPWFEGQRQYYALPYYFLDPRNVLVLGAGAGNDCMEALLHGVQDITAVEIDPQVARIGRDIHPGHPLRDPHVHVIVDDARTFLRNDQQKYDAIIFGTLDSHALFSSMSSVRMENFVYTQQSFRDAAARLSDKGVLIVCVGPMAPWVHARIVAAVEAATGSPAEIYYFDKNIGVVAGPGRKALSELPGWKHMDREGLRGYWATFPGSDIPSTDDWPNIFSQQRQLPTEYVVVLAIVLVGAFVFVRIGLSKQPIHREFFFLGTGFLLLETKSITELGLVFGVTWIVSSIVIFIVLLLIYVATLWSQRRPFPRARIYPVLALSLAVCYGVPLATLALPSLPLRLFCSLLYVGIPVFLAALVFADAYRQHGDLRGAFASNLLGSVLGGVLEYASLLFGLKSLYLIAIAAYCIAWWPSKARPPV